MGVVYQATQLALDRLVALKAMAPQLAQDTDYRERFQRESHIAASIDHPNVIPVYEAGELDGTLFLIMRWVDGTDLRALLGSCGRLQPARTVRLLRPVASALAAAHRRGLVHRDVKPANVLIARSDGEEDEHVYLTDFGIARRTEGEAAMTRTGVLVGTLDYTAPERIEGGRGSAASDIYAFGCMLFEALTGHVPFDRPTELTKMYAHLNDPVPQARSEVPGVPKRLDAIIAKAMAKGPEDRFASAAELASALDRALEQVEIAEVVSHERLERVERPADQVQLGTAADGPTEPVTAATPARADPAMAENTAADRPVTEALPAGTVVDARPPAGRHPSPRPRLLLVAAVGLLVVAGVVVALLAGGGGSSQPVFHARGLKRGFAIDLGATPISVSAAPDGNLWASVPGSGAIVRIDTGTGSRQTVAVGGRPGEIAAGPAGVWVSGSRAGPLALYGPGNGQLLTGSKLTRAPSTIAVNPREGSAWAADASGTVSHVDLRGNIVSHTTVSPAPADIGVGEGWAWVVNGGTNGLVRIGLGNPSQMAFDTRSQALAVTFNKGVWVAHGTGHVTRFNPEPGFLSVNTDRPVAPALDAIAAQENDPFVWAISTQTKTLYQISTTAGAAVTGNVVFPSPPVALAVENRSVWVATEDGKVTQIRF